MAAARQLLIEGSVDRGFERVRDAFIENFTRRRELGAACCIHRDGDKVDPAHRTLGRVFDEEIAGPLGLDCYLRVPASLPDERLAPLEPPARWRFFLGMPLPLVLAAFNKRSVLYRALVANPGTTFYLDPEHRCVRDLEAPSGLGVASARALAKAYGVFAGDGRAPGLSPETLAALRAPAVPPRRGFFDECMRGEAKFSLGFMKPAKGFPFGHEGAFGAPGAGGSFGYADPETGIGYGYVTSRMGVRMSGDPRDVALRAAIPTPARRPAQAPRGPGTPATTAAA